MTITAIDASSDNDTMFTCTTNTQCGKKAA